MQPIEVVLTLSLLLRFPSGRVFPLTPRSMFMGIKHFFLQKANSLPRFLLRAAAKLYRSGKAEILLFQISILKPPSKEVVTFSSS